MESVGITQVPISPCWWEPLDPDPSELAVPIQIRYSSFEVLGWHSIGTLVFSESTRDPIPPIDGREQYHSQSTSIRDVGGIVMRQC